jgi:hypothetical protein
MPNILTASEAATVLRTANDDANMLLLLPQIDAFIRDATGRDWATDATIHVTAKAAARMLLVMWHENPAMIGNTDVLNFGLTSALAQLEVVALRRRTYVFYGCDGAGGCECPGLQVGDQVLSLVGVYGASGSASASFETVVSENGEIQQTATGDLSESIYQVVVISATDALLP